MGQALLLRARLSAELRDHCRCAWPARLGFRVPDPIGQELGLSGARAAVGQALLLHARLSAELRDHCRCA